MLPEVLDEPLRQPEVMGAVLRLPESPSSYVLRVIPFHHSAPKLPQFDKDLQNAPLVMPEMNEKEWGDIGDAWGR